MITIPGEPVGKGRPRFTRQGRVYTPRETKLYEDSVAWHCRAERLTLLEGPLSLIADFYCSTRRAIDLDNLIKALLDGCQRGGALINDSQVVEIQARKFTNTKNPRVEFTLSAFDDSPRQVR